MSFFEWDDKFLTNVERFDIHHKKLVDLLNQLYIDAKENLDMENRRELAEKSLRELIDYTYYHLSAEEELMNKYYYPEYTAHKKEHDQLRESVDAMIAKCKEGKLNVILPILITVQKWLVNHVLVTDKMYSSFFADKN